MSLPVMPKPMTNQTFGSALHFDLISMTQAPASIKYYRPSGVLRMPKAHAFAQEEWR